MPLIIEFEQRRTVGVFIFEMEVVNFRFVGGVATFFAHVYFGSTFFVRVLMLNSVHLETMGFQGTTLREGLLTEGAFVWSHA